jgi:hypothetical protein
MGPMTWDAHMPNCWPSKYVACASSRSFYDGVSTGAEQLCEDLVLINYNLQLRFLVSTINSRMSPPSPISHRDIPADTCHRCWVTATEWWVLRVDLRWMRLGSASGPKCGRSALEVISMSMFICLSIPLLVVGPGSWSSWAEREDWESELVPLLLLSLSFLPPSSPHFLLPSLLIEAGSYKLHA